MNSYYNKYCLDYLLEFAILYLLEISFKSFFEILDILSLIYKFKYLISIKVPEFVLFRLISKILLKSICSSRIIIANFYNLQFIIALFIIEIEKNLIAILKL